MKAIIEVDIPDYQIGQEVSIYFKDTMMIKGVVQEPKKDRVKTKLNGVKTELKQELKTGRWIKTMEGFDKERNNAPFSVFICSECGRQIVCYKQYNEDINPSEENWYPYCHCGAKMSEIPTGSESEDKE